MRVLSCLRCALLPKKGLSSTSSTLCFTANMSLFGSASGFGTGGTSMFGSTTTDNHNPMKVSSKVLQKESGPVFCTADSWGGREKSGEGGISSWPSSRLWTEAQSASCAELVSCPHLELNLTVQSTRESQSFLGQLRTAADVDLNPSHLTGCGSRSSPGEWALFSLHSWKVRARQSVGVGQRGPPVVQMLSLCLSLSMFLSQQL